MNESKYFLDTNIFLRIVAKDNKIMLQECEKLIENINANTIDATTSSLVMAEVVWTCLKGYKLTNNEVKELIKGISSIKNLKFEDNTNIFTAVELFTKSNVKFADCLIASNPKILKGEMTLVSYDKEFDKLKIKRIEPSKLI